MSGVVRFRPHVFEHRGACYAYDPGANEVCKIDPVVAGRLGCGVGGFDRDKLHTTEELRRADIEIGDAVAEGLFCAEPVPELDVCGSCRGDSEYDAHLSQLTLSVTERCNLRCSYCPHTHGGLEWQRLHSDRVMPQETMAAALRYFLPRCADAPVATISFYGGEPLLEFDTIRQGVKIIEEESPRTDIRIVIDTNGVLLGEREVLEFVVDHRLHLQLSLDGPAAIHDRHRVRGDGSPSHAFIMEGLKNLLAMDPEAAGRLRYQVTVVDAGDLERIGAWFAHFPPYIEAGIVEPPTLGVNFVDRSGIDPAVIGLDEATLTAAAGHVARYRNAYIEARRRGDEPDPVARALYDGILIRFYHRSRTAPERVMAPAGFCAAGRRRLHVNVQGEFQPCERTGARLMIGDVASGIDATAAWGLTEEFVASMKERCRRCWAVRLCTICATSMVEGVNVPEQACDQVRASLEETLRLWVDLVDAGDRAMEFLRLSRIS